MEAWTFVLGVFLGWMASVLYSVLTSDGDDSV
jgi:hypothetical protein